MQHVEQKQEMEFENPIAHSFYLKRGKKNKTKQSFVPPPISILKYWIKENHHAKALQDLTSQSYKEALCKSTFAIYSQQAHVFRQLPFPIPITQQKQSHVNQEKEDQK